jgi:cytochrome c553
MTRTGRRKVAAALVGGTILCLGLQATVLAQGDAGDADAKRGAVIAAQGVGDSVPACAQCHGLNGIADVSGSFPRLAGQPAFYLTRQMADYASGVRASAIMEPIAKALSPGDRAATAAYFAGVDAPFLSPQRPHDPALVERGKQLARVGDETKALPSCNNCHGPGGAGEFPAIPYLAGQHAAYTALQLTLWQGGSRHTSPEGMAEIAKRLSEQDIAAVAAYYHQLRGGPESPAQPAK